MKKLLTIILLCVTMLPFYSCSGDEQTAQDNIKHFLITNAKEGTELTFNEFSNLYIIFPKDEKNLPERDTVNFSNFGDFLELNMAGVRLAVEGCTPKVLESIIDNDRKFNEWKTGGKEFVMVTFFSSKDEFLNESDLGLCVRLDSLLNVKKIYMLKDENKIREMISEH